MILPGLGMLRLLTLGLLVLGASGCALRGGEAPARVYWPKPPAEPRLVHEITLYSVADLESKGALERLRRLGSGEGVRGGGMRKPYDVAARQGLVVVSDSVASRVYVFDMLRRRGFAIGWRGRGRLLRPLGVAVDGRRNIYVADAGLGRVMVYSMLGHFSREIGRPADFDRLSDVAVSVDGSRIYALDRGGVASKRHRVLVFSASGEKLGQIGRRGIEPGQFNHPLQLALGPDGRLYVLDAGNFRVQVFSPAGEFIRAWGRPGRLLGNFARPRGIAVDGDNHVYVTDGAYQNFQIFDASGRLLLPVGGPAAEDGPGHYVLPAGIATDETGRVYVVDQFRAKLEVLRLLDEEERRRLAGSPR